jgi:hypothetical protein
MHPDKLDYNHAYDTHNAKRGLAQLRNDAGPHAAEGCQALHREWHGDSRGYKLEIRGPRDTWMSASNLGI